MSAITFIGEGPSPREISAMFELDKPPPRFEERYAGEYSEMYRANGLQVVAGIWHAAHTDMTVRQLAIGVESTILTPGECLFGPFVTEEGLITGSIAWWRSSATALGQHLSSAA